MRIERITALAAAAILAAGSLFARDLRIMTYNVHNGVGVDGVRDHGRVAEVIDRQRADVVAIQEVDSVTGRSGGRYVLGELAAQTAMYPLFAPAIEHDGGLYGIGLLVRHKPQSVSRIALPGREEERALLIADYPDYAVACVHLSLTPDDALESVSIIRREAAARAGKPFILAGDLNSLPGSAVIDSLGRDFVTVNGGGVPTYSADRPADAIDYVMVANSPDCHVARQYVVADTVASDHRPVVATLKLPAGGDGLFWHAPYLQNVTAEGATVMYQTRRRCGSSVEFGTDTTGVMRSARQLIAGQEVVHDLEHKVRLDSLTPGATYYYRIRAREILVNQAYHKEFGREYVSPFYSFTVPAADAENFTALIVNDLHGYGPTIDALAALAGQISHDLVIFNGDCLSEPPTREAAVEDLHVLADVFGLSGKPSLFIRGNHEIRNAYSSGAPSLFDRPGGLTYGAFTLGGIRFVTLDCGEDKPDDTWVYYGLNDFTALRREQAAFLREELKSKAHRQAARRVLIHHIPLWGNTDDYRPCTQMWTPLLKRSDFAVDISAHTHEYRSLEPGAEGNPMKVVVGGGPRPEEATMMVLEKRGKRLSLRVLDSTGREMDRFEL